MNRKWQRWIPAAAFWVLFAASMGFGERCLWLDTVAYAAGMLLPLGLSVYSVAQAFRHGDETGVISHKGTPRWLEKFLMDEDSHQ